MRAKILRFNGQQLTNLLKEGSYLLIVRGNALPNDVKVTSVWVDYQRPNEVTFRIQSDSFPDVPDNNILEVVDSPELQLIKLLEPIPTSKFLELFPPVFTGPTCHFCGSGSLGCFSWCKNYRR